nr:hypothetical protein [uncultured Mucilaginibacter sp.]
MIYPGQQFISQVSNFIDELEIIQNENWWWFKSRLSDGNHNLDDLISNHVVIDYTGFDHLFFKFTDNSDLPDSIKTKCIEAYENVFGKGTLQQQIIK